MSRSRARSPFATTQLAVLLVVVGLTVPGAWLPVLMAGCGIASVAAVLYGVRVRKPSHISAWLLFAAAMLFMVGGNVASMVLALRGGEIPYPSVPEGFYLLAYIACAAAVVRLARLRAHAADPTNLLDAIIFMGGIGTLVWLGVIVPTIGDHQAALSARVTDTAFMAASLLVVGGVCRLAIGPGERNQSYYALAAAGACAIAGEVLIAFGASKSGGSALDPLNAIANCGIFLFVAVSACHPSMRQLSERAVEPMGRMTRRRMVLMAGSTAVVPVCMAALWQGNGLDLAGLLVGWLVVSCSALARVRGLVRSRERLSATEQVLRDAAAALAGSTTRPQMYRAALVAAARLAAPHRATASVPVCVAEFGGGELGGGELGGGELRVAETVDSTIFPVGMALALPHDTMERLATGAPVVVTAGDGAPQSSARAVLLTPLIGRDGLRGALAITTAPGTDEIVAGALATLSSALVLAWDSATSIAEGERQRSQRWFRSLVERSGDVIVLVDSSGDTKFVSPAAGRLLGVDDRPGPRFDLRALVHPEDVGAYDALLAAPASDVLNAAQATVRLRHASGFWRWFDVVASDHRDDDALDGTVVTAREITDRKLAEDRLTSSEARFRSLVQHASDLVLVLEDATGVRYASPSVERLLGLPSAEVVDRDLLALVHPEDQNLFEQCRRALTSGSTANLELRMRHHDRSWRTFEASLTDLRNDDAVSGIVFNAHDVTERKALEGNLRHRVAHDDLTGLGNRVLLRERIEQAFRRRRDPAVVDALLFIDLDDFKTVNDSLGHAAGDELLQVVAHRILASVRPNETAVRLGGDEFALLVQAAAPRAPFEIAQRVLDVLSEPVELGGREYVLGASIGVALSQTEELTAEEMLRNADAAMYSAKRQGKGRVEVFDKRMHIDASDRLELKADLVHALERDQLLVYYQPIVDVRTNRIVGFEALLRWDHPERGLVPPNSFIPLAEETGMICAIGRWLFDVTMAQLVEFQAAHGEAGQLNMSLNLSARQLEDPTVVADLEAALQRSGVDPADITIELTESCAVASADALARLLDIRALGVNLAMDDFGTGEASYAALQTYPFTSVKVDRSILLGLSGPNHDRASAQLASIVNLAKQMGIASLAEGVEGAAELTVLRNLGFDKAQGYYFGRPVPPAAIIAQLVGDRSITAVS